MVLTILKDGTPATNLRFTSGMLAHAVFGSIDDLGDVQAHAMVVDAAKHRHASHGAHDDQKAAISAKLMLRATASRAGRDALWSQLKGGGQVRTAPFVVTAAVAL